MANIRINVRGLATELSRVNNLRRSAARVAVRTGANTLTNLIRLNFTFGRRPSGGSWARLKYRSGQPLLDTGRLRDSITTRILTPYHAQIGTRLAYAASHQFGYAPRNIPARPYLPINASGGDILPRAWRVSVERDVLAAITRLAA